MPVITVQISSRNSDQVKLPIVWRVGKEFDVTTHIRRAQVTDDYGFIELDIEGPLEEAQRAVSWLHTTGLQVSAIDRSVGKDTQNL